MRLTWVDSECPAAAADAPESLTGDILDVAWRDAECEIRVADAVVARWNPKAAAAQVFLPPERHEAWASVLRWVLQRSQNEFDGGFTLHASAIEIDGRATVFCGPSGAGKSTLRGLAEPSCRLDDEFCDVARAAEGFALRYAGRTIPIERILFPRRGTESRLTPVPRASALVEILSGRYPGLWHDRHPEEALAVADAVSAAVPCFEFHCPADVRSIRFLERSRPRPAGGG